MDDQLNQNLKQIYYNPQDPGSLGGVKPLLKRAKELGYDVNERKVKAFLAKEDTYTIHKPIRKHYARLQTIVAGIDYQWQADLVDMSEIGKKNDGFRYIMTVIDVFSKVAWAVPLKNKSAPAMVVAFETLFEQANPRVPRKIQADKGKEFLNRLVQDMLKDKGIHHFVTQSDTKASVVERFNRTLKTRMWRFFTAKNTYRYLDVLPQLIQSYNLSFHRTIGMRPLSVTPINEQRVWTRMFGKLQAPGAAKFETGDMVRLSKVKRLFEKGYQPNWTEEHFTVTEKVKSTPRVYKIKDFGDQPIEGKFYKEELQKIVKTVDDQYVIEKIIQKRSGQVLVKWRGWPEKFNSWIPEADVVDYHGGS